VSSHAASPQSSCNTIPPSRLPRPSDRTKADEFHRIEVITGVGRRRRWTDEENALK
jgi:hypothetical protein